MSPVQTPQDPTVATPEVDEKAQKAQEKADAKRAADERKAAEKAKREQEKIEKEMEELPEDKRSITGTGPDGAVTLRDVREAVKAHRKAEREAKPKQAPLTLSQRRALVKLQEDGPQVAKTDFNTLPYEHLVAHGLATKTDVTVPEPYTAKEEQEVEIPEAERKEGGPTTKKVKVDVEKTRDVVRPQYEATEKGMAREVNKKWKTWKPAGSGSASDAA